MPFEQSIIWLLLGAILGSGGAVLAGKTVLKRRGMEPEDLEELMRVMRARQEMRKAFEKEKQANIIKAIMNTAVSVTASLPNVPLSILAGVLGAVQVGLIANQPVPKFAKGGTFGGNSHSNGGTKGYFSDGTQIEVEKDENFYILNKNASRHINGLSNLNQQFGGIPLMANGGAVTSSGITANSITNSVDSSLNAQNKMMRMIEMMPKPVVIVQDINDAQGNLASVENRANF